MMSLHSDLALIYSQCIHKFPRPLLLVIFIFNCSVTFLTVAVPRPLTMMELLEKRVSKGRDKNISLSRCPCVLGQGQEQKSQDKLLCPVPKGNQKTEKRRSKTEKRCSKTGKGRSKTEKDVLKQKKYVLKHCDFPVPVSSRILIEK